MSQAKPAASIPIPPSKSTADSLSRSILWLASLVILQRGIGFLRSFYVCGQLSSAEVGQWDLAFNFLGVMAPLAVLGIPGSFGRYLPRYEAEGTERKFLSQTLLASLGLSLLASGMIWIFRQPIARVFLGSTDHLPLVAILAVGLPFVALFNFANSWFTGKRQNRFVFRIQFSQALFFACLCVFAFQFFAVNAESVVIAYLASCLVGLILAAAYVTRLPVDSEVPTPRNAAIWSTILPFAAWVWVSNAMFNLFATCDRLLLVNFYSGEATDISYLIGQYHTACIFPLLLMSLGAMAGSMLMPYLSKPWEAGDSESVTELMNLMLKSIGLLCLVLSAAVFLVAPVLFGNLWRDKFAIGESLLPLTLSYCSLAAMTFVAQKYFWCIEKTWFSSLLLMCGLGINFVVGLALIRPLGIDGVVLSTWVAHATILLSVIFVCRGHGLKIEARVGLVILGLLGVGLGKWITCISVLLLVTLSLTTHWVFTESQRQLLKTHINRGLQKMGVTL